MRRPPYPSNLRVAYDYQIFSLQEYGGISRYFLELANNIAALSPIDVSVIAPCHMNFHLTSASHSVKVRGTRIPQIPHTGRIRRFFNQRLGRLLTQAFGADLVHETYYCDRSTAPRTSRIVLTVFDMIHERFPQHFPVADSTRRLKATAVHRADHIICISEQTRSDLIHFLNVDPRKTSVVPLGFTLRAQPSSTASAPHKPFLLYVGSRSGYKNFQGLLTAYASLPAIRRNYDLIAFGGGPFSSHEEQLLRTLSLSTACVRQVGGNDAALASLYQRAALFVYPSLYEGFGLPPLEAMSFRCPVACSNTGSLPEVVGDAATLFDPASPEEIAAAIESILGDAAMKDSLALKGLERLRLFSWERCARQTLGIYREVLQ